MESGIKWVFLIVEKCWNDQNKMIVQYTKTISVWEKNCPSHVQRFGNLSLLKSLCEIILNVNKIEKEKINTRFMSIHYISNNYI